MSTRKLRSEVSSEQTWDLTHIFKSQQEFDEEYAAILRDIPTVTKYQGQLGTSSATLRECLLAREGIQRRLVNVVVYAMLAGAGDGSDTLNQANSARASALYAQVDAAFAFIKSEIIDMPLDTILEFVREDSELASFERWMLELLETKAHQLSPETEEVLASLGEVFEMPYVTYERAKSSDMQFAPIVGVDGQTHPMSLALYEDHYELSTDTDLRRKAFDSFTSTLNQYKNTFAATYATEVKKQVALAKLRGYESASHMLLEPQHVTLEMYNNLHDIIQTELAPHMRRFAKLKQRILGLDKMYHCDLKAPLDADYSPNTTFEEARKVILDALSVMGPEYISVMERAFNERWIDYADNVGKSTGAFCYGPYDIHPYILITWTDTMRGAFVLAHELGHAGHAVFSNDNQRIHNTDASMYFSEAPSTINELLLGQHILEKSSDERMKRWVISQLLGTYYHNFVTHMLEAELQRRVYRLAEAGTPITANFLCDLKGQVLQEFWGDAVEIDDRARLTWMRQPHYYMGLYPYTYSAGLTASTAVAALIREEGQPAVERWLDVLRAGGTMLPLDLLKHAGVDMSQPDPIRTAVAYVGSLVDELERSF